VFNVSPVLRTPELGVGWIQGGFGVYDSDEELGRQIDLRNDQVSINYDIDRQVQNKSVWFLDDRRLKVRVYNLEVEEHHTYYVGELGVWVHNTNCGDIGVQLVEAAAGVRPTPSARVYSIGESLALAGEHKGIVLVVEDTAGAGGAEALSFQRATEGALQTRDGTPVAWTYRYRNPVANGENVTRAGDGRARMPDGSWSMTTIDAKLSLGPLYDDAIVLVVRQGVQNKALKMFQRISNALEQNPGYSHIIEFATREAFNDAVHFCREVVYNQGYLTNISLRMRGDAMVTVFTRNAEGQVIEQQVRPTFTRVPEAGNPLPDVAREFISNERHQDVSVSATGSDTSVLTIGEMQPVLSAAKQYWLDAGASGTALTNARVAIGDLQKDVLALTSGLQITLSVDAAGWGWFVDATPALNEEFAASGSALGMDAGAGSPASGKIDLLTVLIHELGHVLNLEHRVADDVMTRSIDPGERRLPNPVDAAYLAFASRSSTPTTATSSGAATASRTWTAPFVNNDLQNGDFEADGTAGWVAEGEGVHIAGNTVTLGESATRQTHLSQGFILSAGDRALSFTTVGQSFSNNASGPGDAFEVALLDANTGLPVAGTVSLSTCKPTAPSASPPACASSPMPTAARRTSSTCRRPWRVSRCTCPSTSSASAPRKAA
jgi:hypothetical protein